MRIRRPLLLAAVLLQVGAAAEASPEAAISGRVLDSAAAPVIGARVAVFRYRSPERLLLDRTLGVEPSSVADTKTDSRGAFRLAAPKPGDETSLRIVASGLPSVDIAGPFDPEGTEEALEVTISAVKKVSGRITDEAGRPVSGARIRAEAPAEFPEDGIAFAEGKSEANGSFVLAYAPTGQVVIDVLAAGFAPLATEATRPDQRFMLKRGGGVEGTLTNAAGKPVSGAIVAASDSATQTNEVGRYRFEALAEGFVSLQVAPDKDDRAACADHVRIRRGANTRADLVLKPAIGVAGIVVDGNTRRPLSRVRVEAFDTPLPLPGMFAARQTRTDARGRFRLVGLTRREYRVTASGPSYLPTTVPVVAATPPSGPVRIALARGATVRGRVVDEGGKAISGARVQRLPGEGRQAMLQNNPAAAGVAVRTREDGSFALSGLPRNAPASLLASREGYVAARRDGIAATVEGGKPITLVLRGGREARGRVVNGNGEPVVGARVSLSRTEEHRLGGGAWWSGETFGAARGAVSDAEGKFVLQALEAGKYSARIQQAAYAGKSIASLEVKATGITQWDPFVLSPAVLVAGVVRNKKGEPIVGATITSYGGGGGYGQSQADAEGRFREEGYAAGASLTLEVEADGYAHTRQSVTAPAPDLAIVLSTSGVIRGRVEDAATQEPVTAFHIEYEIPRGYSSDDRGNFQSDGGTFEISDVPPGKGELTASSPGYLPGKVAGVEVAEGEVKEGVVVSLRKGRQVSGRVLDAGRGTGVSNATVSWRRSSEVDHTGVAMGPGGAFAMVPNAAATDADGRFVYDAVPPEKLIFKASHPDFLDSEKTVDTSVETSIDLMLSDGGSISGNVVGSDGRSRVPGAQVSLAESGAPAMAWSGDETRADDSGSFSFPHLREGRYRLIATAQSGRTVSTEVVLSPGQNTEGVVLAMKPGATLRGHVTGLPTERLGGLRISAYSPDFDGSASTGPEGEFTIENVMPGIVRVSASPAQWLSGRAVSKNVEIPEGATEVAVELAFEGASRLLVHVTRREKPITGLTVHAGPDPLFSPGLQETGQTDGDGRCTLEELADGPYLLRGVGEGVYFTRSITVSGDTSVDVTLGASSISGSVTDASSGEPLADVGVAAETGQETSRFQVRNTQTDSQGYYVMDDLDPGTFQVTARRDGYRQKTLPVTLGDSPAQLSFTLSRGGGLTIRASDGLSGLALSGLTVLAFSDTGAIAFSGAVALDATGTGEVASLAAGTYSLYVFSDGYAPQVLAAVPVPSAPITLSLTPGGRVEVRSAAAVGRILNAAGMLYLASPWRLDGRLSIAPPMTAWDHMAPGSYQLVVEGPDGGKAFPFTIAEGQTTRIEVP